MRTRDISKKGDFFLKRKFKSILADIQTDVSGEQSGKSRSRQSE